MFSSARNVEIHGGASNTVYGDQYNTSYTVPPNNILEFVASKAAVNAFYNAGQRYPPPNCHPGTRVNVLALLNRWILEEPKSARIYWVYGSAGVGKSAIAQRLSEEHAGPKGRLAASFFFSRSDTTRDNLESFVPTVVYQLLTSEHLQNLLARSILETIRSDPTIFDKAVDYQFRKLIVEPCSSVSVADWETLPNLVVIDGIDECVDIASQKTLLGMIQGVMPTLGLVFLIYSRPEPHIHHELSFYGQDCPLGRLPLDDSSESNEDMVLYFRHRFGELQAKYPSLQRPDMSWGSEDVIRRLAQKACGQFIFATTVMNYLDCGDDLPGPPERLQSILTIKSRSLPDPSPYSDLDFLYQQILLNCRNWDAVRKILSLLVTPHRPLVTPHPFPRCDLYDQHGQSICDFGQWRSSTIIGSLLNFASGDVNNLLSRLHSVILVPAGTDTDLHILHASFIDFLLDRNRSGEYHIKSFSKSEYFGLVTALLLRQINELSALLPPHSKNPLWWVEWDGFVRRSNDLTRYAVRNCFVFCQQVKSPSEDLSNALEQFDPYPVATIVINLEEMGPDLGLSMRHYFDFWKSAVTWAKSLGKRKPRQFIKTMEAFLDGFKIVAAPATRGFWAGPAALCTSALAAATDSHWMHLLYCISLLYRLFTSREYMGRLSRIYILPIALDPIGLWSTITATCKRGTKFNRLATAVYDGSSESIEKILRDIAFGTHESVPTLNVSKRNSLRLLRRLVKRWRKQLGLPPYTYNGLGYNSDRSSSDSSRRNHSNASIASSHRNRSFVVTDHVEATGIFTI